MNALHKTIHIPSATLKLLIGEGSINEHPFRRNRIERFWGCGCLAEYEFDKFDDVRWTPCERHKPSLPMT